MHNLATSEQGFNAAQSALLTRNLPPHAKQPIINIQPL